MDKLLNIVALLRDKKYGCPWDLEQTHTSLVRYTLEEVYEVVDAIETGTANQLKDELGDLLFQVVFYAQIAQEDEQFNFADIIDAISDKLLRRHPHVFPQGKLENFGQDQNLNADDVVVNWEAIKEQERKLEGAPKAGSNSVSVLANIPTALPALERSLKMQKRAASAGFDWTSFTPVLDKIKEELSEVEEAISADDASAIEEEIGDLLFAAVNLARHMKIEPENALRNANRKFEQRFRYIEEQLQEQNKKLGDVGLEKLDEIWDQAKAKGL